MIFLNKIKKLLTDKDCISDMNSYLNDQERENYKENYDCSITGQGPPQVTSAEKNKLLARLII